MGKGWYRELDKLVDSRCMASCQMCYDEVAFWEMEFKLSMLEEENEKLKKENEKLKTNLLRLGYVQKIS